MVSGHAQPQWSPLQLIRTAVDRSSGASKDRYLLVAAAHRLEELDDTTRMQARALVDHRLAHSVDLVLEHGWQPAELMHAARRTLDPSALPLLHAAIGDHARRWSAATTAPEVWVAQLDDMGIEIPAGDADWWTDQGYDAVEIWVRQMAALAFLQRLPKMTPLLAVPSSWATMGARTTSTPVGDPRVLARIRGLLAKAESTAFAAEAEALSEKAQDLMTRHAIDTAMVESIGAAPSTPVATRRFLIDNPYPETKVALLAAVAEANGVRVLWHRDEGLVAAVGLPGDLDSCELLFTSLLLQGSHAVRESCTHQTQRTPSYRRSFLYAFANRIGERLRAARDHATHEAQGRHGSAVVPVMAALAEAVDDAFDEQFPHTRSVSTSVSNGAGWVAGRVAADQADLTIGGGRIAR